jgi:hypothetical protein
MFYFMEAMTMAVEGLPKDTYRLAHHGVNYASSDDARGAARSVTSKAAPRMPR